MRELEKKVTCRPCKEQNNWEIEDENGVVLKKHYQTKEECVCAGEKLACECGCELCVENHPASSNNNN